ncbi:hypothetical protein Fcan01_22356, partial [Folsomia candida]
MDSIPSSAERTRSYRASRTEEQKKKQKEIDRLRMAKKRAEEKERRKKNEEAEMKEVQILDTSKPSSSAQQKRKYRGSISVETRDKLKETDRLRKAKKRANVNAKSGSSEDGPEMDNIEVAILTSGVEITEANCLDSNSSFEDSGTELCSQISSASAQRVQVHRGKATEPEKETRRRSERIRIQNSQLMETAVEEAQRRSMDAVRHYLQRQQQGDDV